MTIQSRPVLGLMDSVKVDNAGVLKNLLAGNYSDEQIVYEYLNNVLSKNKDKTNYSINYGFRNLYEKSNFGTGTLFIFQESNCIGFKETPNYNDKGIMVDTTSAFDMLQNAYQIAKSDRSGTNNMGNGIYSPLTIDKTNDSLHLFIQHNENGSFYSVAYFDSIQSDSNELPLCTKQGEIVDNKILGFDVLSILDTINNGTLSIWCSDGTKLSDNRKKFDYKFVEYIIKLYNKPAEFSHSNDIDINIGKRYHYYLDRGISINRIDNGDNNNKENNILIPVEKQNILEDPPMCIRSRMKEYHIRITKDRENKNMFLIKRNYDGGTYDWMELKSENTFGRPRNDPISDKPEKLTRDMENNAQDAIYTVYDYEIDEDHRIHGRDLDRCIWVNIDNIYISKIELSFPPQFSPNPRFTLKFTDSNKVDKYMALNINKSNSRMNDDILNRLNFLSKWTLKEWYKSKSPNPVNKHIPYNFDKLNGKSLLILAKLLKIPYKPELDEESEMTVRKSKDFKHLYALIEKELKINV